MHPTFRSAATVISYNNRIYGVVAKLMNLVAINSTHSLDESVPAGLAKNSEINNPGLEVLDVSLEAIKSMDPLFLQRRPHPC
ncbi:MAG: hypothetical protein IPJ26_17605 [Bacteroidetes bacterium]|nr:hypothetical protein [Bacteroidota bacterium]